jgi:AcrR family transcriptional regulator
MDPKGGILKSAQRVFARHGFRQTAMAMVAEEAGLSRQALYHHFDSKEALFAALVDDLHADALAAARAAAGKGGRSASEAIANIMLAYHASFASSVAGSPFAAELLEEGMRRCAPAIAGHTKAFDKLLETAIAGLARAGKLSLRAMTARELAEMMGLAAKGAKVAHASGDALAHATALRRMIEVICAGAGALPAKAQQRMGTVRRMAR